MAIAFDSSAASQNSGTSQTFALTTSGSNRILFVGIFLNSGANTDAVTGVTYNGVAMSQVNKISASADYTYLYMLVAPATGANNVVISCNTSIGINGFAASYTGASQTGQPDANATNSVTAGSATSLTTSVTVVAANSWLVSMGRWDMGNIAAGSGTLKRQTTGNTGSAFFDSNGAVAAGSRSLIITGDALAGGTSGAMNMASFSPAAAAGPANLKSLDGNVKANIKSFDGNVIANIKSIDGNS